MEKKEILCPQCGHRPFRNKTGLSWHLWHNHGRTTANSTRENQQNTIAVSGATALPGDLQKIDTGSQSYVVQKVLATAEASRRQKEGETRSDRPALKKLSAYEYINKMLDQAAAKKESAKK